ncbi:MAG: phenylalanine--tRNA ligase subunit beta [Bacteroidales bacterium]|jgi:phenylalanyl-tRNA synthetase beta chain|nr:phenylalanine--tRNA ligase subunit beta [Bacteroidales bacterium]
MKISYNWLKEYATLAIDANKTAQMLTDCGLEVELTENFETIGGGLQNVVIGKVLSCEKHPDADRLSVTTVDVGAERPLNIVCGAPNVATGQTVVVAMLNAVLYPTDSEPFKIKKSKIRGIESEGMICAQDELGLGTSHDGIMLINEDVKAGTPAAQYFDIQTDTIFEIGITPNRNDALSHIGVARDWLAVANYAKNTNFKLQYPDVENFKPEIQSDIQICIEDEINCVRYTGLIIKGVKVEESPKWLKNKLNSIGVRPVNNVVDATQFVLFEMGQPLHAFDAKKIAGKKVIIKKAQQGEQFVTLDGIKRTLSADDLMICNANEAMCVAGVFGGQDSGVTEETVDIFLESAAFHPVSIRKTAKYHGLKTDASFRYERGSDPNITVYAAKRAALLIQQLAGGQISEITDIYPNVVSPKEIEVNLDRLNSLIGKNIDKQEVIKILELLEIKIIAQIGQILKVEIPTNKADVLREADVVEEFLRIYGYNNVEIPHRFNYAISTLKEDDLIHIQEVISTYLSDNGFFETMNNSLTKAEYAVIFDFVDASQSVTLLNPLSKELQNLRQNLFFNSMENILHNIHHGNTDLKLYEFGKIYQKNSQFGKNEDILKRFDEPTKLSICVTGKQKATSWLTKQEDADFYYLKNVIINALKRVNVDIEQLPTEISTSLGFLDNALIYKHKDTVLLAIGEVPQKLLKTFGIKQPVFYADIDCRTLELLAKNKKTVFEELHKFPEVERDLALLIDKTVTYQQLKDIAFRCEKHKILSVNLFDVYQGDKLPENKKSYALRFVLYDKHKTLTNNDIQNIMDRLINAYQKEVHAELR